MNTFETELVKLLNRYNQESGSNTPDYVLVIYVLECLRNFNDAVNMRTRHYEPEENIDG